MLLRVQSIDEGSDVCPCRTLGRRHFFLYVKRVTKETKQTDMLSFGHGERKQIRGTPFRNEKDQGQIGIGRTENIKVF